MSFGKWKDPRRSFANTPTRYGKEGTLTRLRELRQKILVLYYKINTIPQED